MDIRVSTSIAVAIVVIAGVALIAHQQKPPTSTSPVLTSTSTVDWEVDRAAIEKSAREFVEAFNRADARAIAAMWTKHGELHQPAGGVVRGRASIETAFAEFFKANPQTRIEVLVEAIRFPATDLAIEEGILRQTRYAKDLPTSTVYRVTHVREEGKWRMAVSDEMVGRQDRLEDLEWLLGVWQGRAAESEMTLSFSREARKPFILGKFTRMEAKKEVASGTIRIAVDPESGRLRSWHFEDDGGHGQALWVRDANHWVLDSKGVLADGTPTASLNLLGRVDADTITWRSIDRMANGQSLPDTVPVRLHRSTSKK